MSGGLFGLSGGLFDLFGRLLEIFVEEEHVVHVVVCAEHVLVVRNEVDLAREIVVLYFFLESRFVE